MLRAERGVRPADVLTVGILSARGRTIRPKTLNQKRYADAIDKHTIVFAIGPAGTGKTYLAVAAAVDLLMTGRVERIILSRPAVEAGERLGFLPGDLRDKVDPYLRPIFDALNDMLPADQLAKRLGTGEIEVAPIAFMRGRTLSHAFVILDEAQNTTPVQMKMFLTRLGEASRMVVTGDPTQVDLPAGTRSGLAEALETLRGVDGIATVRAAMSATTSASGSAASAANSRAFSSSVLPCCWATICARRFRWPGALAVPAPLTQNRAMAVWSGVRVVLVTEPSSLTSLKAAV